MKQGWVDVVKKINAGVTLTTNEASVEATVSSWLEEERDMALMLSRNLGLLVKSGQHRFKNDLKGRIEFEKKQLINNKFIESSLQIDGAASEIVVRPIFDRRNIEMSINVLPPQDRQTRPQITWIRNQLKYFFDNIDNPKLINNIFDASKTFRKIIEFRQKEGIS